MKAMMSWSETMSVGDPEIDEQHRTLIGMMNDLYAAFREGNADGRLDGLFEDLTAYTRLHFRNEENYFDKFDYPEKKMHVAAHEGLTRKLASFRTRYEQTHEDLSVEMLGFLRDWILGHIMQVDVRYRPYLHHRDTVEDSWTEGE